MVNEGHGEGRHDGVVTEAQPVPNWQWASFDGLSLGALYEILKLRQAVFVVEQNCAYQDADSLDRVAWHLAGWRGEAGRSELLAYLRVVFPGNRYSEPSIGRVLTAKTARGTGAGKALMREALARVEQAYPGASVRISAQCYLERFYAGFGFLAVSEPYDEDGIAHIEMLRAPLIEQGNSKQDNSGL